MIACRYVSADSSEIGEREFDAVGQKAVFSESQYRDVVLGGAAFLPEEEFLKLGFTEVELEKFGQIGVRVDPTESFCNKLIRGQERFREIMAAMVREASARIELAKVSGLGSVTA